MKQIKTFKISSGKTYLSDDSAFFDIPAGLFNKSETGCGATSILLENGINYIIAVPTKNLIRNKCSKYNVDGRINLLGVYSGVTSEDISTYMNDDSIKVKKVITTYDSLERTISVIGKERINEFQIAIDEFHQIIKSYTFRDDAIAAMLKAITPYVSQCRFISATPIPFSFLPEVMQDIDSWIVEWEDSKKVEVKCLYQKSPVKYISKIINDYKNNQTLTMKDRYGNVIQSKEAFFYINCVNDIINVIKASGLTPEETRIVCSDKDANRTKLPKGFTVSEILDKNTQLKEIADGKVFTFITATAFEGVDFFSPTAVTFIMSNIGKYSTCLDISCDIKQIVGRIRDDRETYGVNPFKGIAYHIHNSGVINEGKEGFVKELTKAKAASEKHIALFNNDTETYKTMIMNGVGLISPFYCAKIKTFNNTDIPYYDTIRESALKHQFEQVISAYESGFSVREEHEKAGRNAEVIHSDIMLDCPTISTTPKTEAMFKNKIDQYRDLLSNYDDTWAIRQFERDPKNKVCVLAYKYLTEAKMKALKYRESDCMKAIKAKMISGTCVASEVKRVFQVGERYSNADIKERLVKLYAKYDISVKPKASDLSEYFNVKTYSVKGLNGLEIISRHTKAQKEAEELRLAMEQMGIV